MIDTPLRSLLKAITWQALGLLVMIAITWAVTGSVATGGIVAVFGAITGTVTYILHERAWSRVKWGRTPAPQ